MEKIFIVYADKTGIYLYKSLNKFIVDDILIEKNDLSKINYLDLILSKVSTTGLKCNRILGICNKESKFDYLCFVEPTSKSLYRSLSFVGNINLTKIKYEELNSISEEIIPDKKRIITIINLYSMQNFIELIN